MPLKERVIRAESDLNKIENIIQYKIPNTVLGYNVVNKSIFSLTKGTPILKLNFYSHNIDTLYISINLKPMNIWVNIYKISMNPKLTFQEEESIELDSTILKRLVNKKYFDNVDSFSISEIRVIGSKKQKNQDCTLILGEANIYDRFRETKYFFNTLGCSFNKLNWSNDIQKIKDNAGVFLEIPNLFERYGDTPYLELVYPSDSLSQTEKIKYVSTYIAEILKKYPYFEEKGIDKHAFMSEYLEIVKKSKSLDEYYELTESFLTKLDDIHNKLINLKRTKSEVKQPIHFYRINNNIQAVAIMDTTLNKKILLGDRLVMINGILIEPLLKELENKVIANTLESNERKVIQKLLSLSYEKFHSGLQLKFLRNGTYSYSVNLDSSKIYKNKNLVYPKNFRAINGLVYKKINEFAYLRIGEFYEQFIIPFMYTYIDSLKNSSGLILDLRNNSEGDVSFATVFSFFTNHANPIVEFPIANIDDIYSMSSGYETWVIKPSKFFYYDKPIAVIVDSRTTCASEYLINALKKIRKDVVVLGISNTAAAARVGKLTFLPSCNSFSGGVRYSYLRTYDASGESIESNKGVKPSITTFFDSYLDLAPYNDKLLQLAIKYLKNY
ncbi:MAG: hypothetical protein HXX16_02585 [Bacteroidales bacterium]|nr:hypothetical protein [Bacteroidales bacterium]